MNKEDKNKVPYSDMCLAVTVDMNDFEEKFIISIKKKCYSIYAKSYWLTDKQFYVFEKILSRARNAQNGSVAEKYLKIFRLHKKQLSEIDLNYIHTYDNIYKENKNIKKGMKMLMAKHRIKKVVRK